MKKSFCGGVICNKNNRKNKCLDCDIYVCGACSMYVNDKFYCVDCGLERAIIHANNNIDKIKSKLKDSLLERQSEIIEERLGIK